jgi:hypothetical protein
LDLRVAIEEDRWRDWAHGERRKKERGRDGSPEGEEGPYDLERDETLSLELPRPNIRFTSTERKREMEYGAMVIPIHRQLVALILQIFISTPRRHL